MAIWRRACETTLREMSRRVQPRSPSPSFQLKCARFSTTAGCPANGGGSSCGWTTSSCCNEPLAQSEMLSFMPAVGDADVRCLMCASQLCSRK